MGLKLILLLVAIVNGLKQADVQGRSFRAPGNRFSHKCDRPGTNTVVMIWFQPELDKPERTLILQVWATEPSVNEQYKDRISFSHRNQAFRLFLFK